MSVRGFAWVRTRSAFLTFANLVFCAACTADATIISYMFIFSLRYTFHKKLSPGDRTRTHVFSSFPTNWLVTNHSSSTQMRVTQALRPCYHKPRTDERIITYYIRALEKPKHNYCVTQGELLAVMKAVEHFHVYLYRGKITIRSDHSTNPTTQSSPQRHVKKHHDITEGDLEIKKDAHQGLCKVLLGTQ